MNKLSNLENTIFHILAVDDDTRLRKLIKKYLRENGFFVTSASSAEEARQYMECLEFDLLVIDIMMPGEDGMDLTSSIRKKSKIPILMLTAVGEQSNIIQGLERGADDYMIKPFEPREFLLRIKSILKRVPPVEDKASSEIRFGECLYNFSLNSLTKKGVTIHLTTAETELLRTLALNANNPVARKQLYINTTENYNPRTIDVQITRLRKKVESDPSQPKYLQTIRGTGYLLRTD